MLFCVKAMQVQIFWYYLTSCSVKYNDDKVLTEYENVKQRCLKCEYLTIGNRPIQVAALWSHDSPAE